MATTTRVWGPPDLNVEEGAGDCWLAEGQAGRRFAPFDLTGWLTARRGPPRLNLNWFGWFASTFIQGWGHTRYSEEAGGRWMDLDTV